MGGPGRRPGDEQAEAAVQKQKLRAQPALLGTRVGLGHRVQNLTFIGYPQYIHQLTDEYTSLRSSAPGIFLGFGTKEYSLVIFLGSEEYKKPRKIPYFPVVRGW
jgi:hypothetical protein